MVYWIISVPYTQSAKKTFVKIRKDLSKILNKKSDVFDFNIPQLKIGSLETLFTLSEDLSHYDSLIENVTTKVLRTYGELLNVSEDESKTFQPTIELPGNNSVHAQFYLQRFNWDENQYLINKPLIKTAKTIQNKISKLDSELKQKYNEYHEIKSNITQIRRKQTGPLSVRPLDGIINENHIVDSEYLKTLFVVVPKDNQKEWLKKYEKLDDIDLIVPGSSEKIAEDDDYILNSVVVMRKISGDYKNACIKKKYIVREFTYDEKRFKLSKMETDKLDERMDSMKKELIDWSKVAFSECFSSWIHIKGMRTFVETILLYGLPPKFVPVLIQIAGEHGSSLHKNEQKKIHNYFKKNFKFLQEKENEFFNDIGGGASLKQSDEVSMLSGHQSHGIELNHPYVLITINTNYPLLNV